MIQWFPGHMAKTRKLIQENIKIVDVVVELADARLPGSSRNPLLDELIGDKPRLLLLTKEDLAEAELTRTWLASYIEKGIPAFACSFTQGGQGVKKRLLEKIREQAVSILEKRKKKGIINKTVRAMIVGIPNVGKSTLINFMAGRSAAETGDRPGVTRGKQWIRLGQDIELLDMPGILWPKFENRETGLKLAVTGAIRDQILDGPELAEWLIEQLLEHYPGRLATRYCVAESGSPHILLEAMGKKRGFLKTGGVPDLEKAAAMLLDEFRAGKLGPVTLDREINETGDALC